MTDAAGMSSSLGIIPFTVNNAAPPIGGGGGGGTPNNGSPAVNTPVVTFDNPSYVRPRGTPAVIKGKVRTSGGEPINGASLEVSSRRLGTDDLEEGPGFTVKTNADGSFNVPLVDDGAFLMRAEFTPYSGAGVTAAATTVVRTEAAIALRANKRHIKRKGRVTLLGKLMGMGASADGTTVVIQAVVRGRWRAVGSAVAKADGSFKWRYRFVAVNRSTKFAFRGVVVKRPGWPWPTATSSRAKVRVGG